MSTSNFKIYQTFNSADVITGKFNAISSGFFPGNNISYVQNDLTVSPTQQATASMFGGTYDILNGLYYTEVYDNAVTNPQPLFTLTYGNILGSGSSNPNINQTKAVYSQYKNTLLGTADVDGKFSFKSGSISNNTLISSDDIFVINFSAVLGGNQIDTGQWCLYLSGSNGVFGLIDESPLLTSAQLSQTQLVYEVIVGQYDSTQGKTVDGGLGYTSLGLFYPKNGIIVLNALAVSNLIGGVVIPSTDINYPNGPFMDQYHTQLYPAMVNISPVGLDYGTMRVRKTEFVPSTHYFVRVKNQDYNFSNNPTFVYNSTVGQYTRGDIIDSLSSNPTTYITTIGLYNDLNELVAVAKLSRPTRKDFVSEGLFRVRLDF